MFSLESHVRWPGEGSVLWRRRAGLRFLCLSTQQGQGFPSSAPCWAIRSQHPAYPHTPEQT